MTELDDFNDPLLEIRYTLHRHRNEARRLREMILRLVDAGAVSQRDIAKSVGVSAATINNWVKTARDERDNPAR